jgi:phospholipase/lecithinase/hemolysin
MRNSPVPVWARCAIFVAALISAIAVFAPGAPAEEKFKRLIVFGDSYTDSDLAGLWKVYPLSLQEQLAIAQAVNFGVGQAGENACALTWISGCAHGP